MPDEIKVGDRVRLTGFGKVKAEGVLEKIIIHSGGSRRYEIDGKWYSNLGMPSFWTIEKILEGEIKEKVREKVEEKRTTMEEDFLSVLIG